MVLKQPKNVFSSWSFVAVVFCWRSFYCRGVLSGFWMDAHTYRCGDQGRIMLRPGPEAQATAGPSYMYLQY